MGIPSPRTGRNENKDLTRVPVLKSVKFAVAVYPIGVYNDAVSRG